MSACRIKCCGMFREQDIQAVNAARPDYCGFVVGVPGSRRSVSSQKAAELRKLLDPAIKAVGVFVDEEDPGVPIDLYETGAIDVIQLHGQESDAYVQALAQATDAPVIKAFKVQGPADVRAANESSADYVLLDGGAGQGRAFDWGLAAGMRRPFFLAGGLAPETIPDALAACRPFAVDLSSGLETDGLKDPQKIRAAVAAVRAHE